MEKKEVVIDNPVVIAGVTLLPLARVSMNYWHSNGGISFFGSKQPVSLVVVTPSGKRAFRITGEEISLEQLVRDFPGLKEKLENLD